MKERGLRTAALAAGPGEAAAGDCLHREAEDVFFHAGVRSSAGDGGFDAAIDEATEEHFVFGALIGHSEKIAGGGRGDRGEWYGRDGGRMKDEL